VKHCKHINSLHLHPALACSDNLADSTAKWSAFLSAISFVDSNVRMSLQVKHVELIIAF